MENESDQNRGNDSSTIAIEFTEIEGSNYVG
jgi:hypothetical protein